MPQQGKMSSEKKKWIVFSLLNLGLIPLVLARAESVYSGNYVPFMEASIVLLALSLVLSWRAGWSLHLGGKRNDDSQEEDKGKDESRLLNFLRFFLMRYFVGEALSSLYGLYIFALFAITITAWLPDGFENGNVPFILASITYFLSSVFFTAWVYGPPERRKSSIEVLVFPLSIPRWKPEDIDVEKNPELCEKLCRNEDPKTSSSP